MCHSVTFLFAIHLILKLCFVLEAEAFCHAPLAPKDGSRSDPELSQFETGSIVKFYCRTNYTLEGAPKIICLESGRWDSKTPRCIDPCGVCLNDGKCVQQSRTGLYKCICQEGFRGPVCDIPMCKKPVTVWNGGYIAIAPLNGVKFDIGTKLVFNCDTGYVLSGISYGIKCILDKSRNGRWSRSFPVCKPQKCKNLLEGGKLANGDFTPNKEEYSIGDQVVFTCNAGFELHSSSSMSCGKNGLWSSVSWPRCFPKKCLNPPEIQHGRVIQSETNFFAGAVIRFECKTGEGYFLYGSRKQTCNPDSNGQMKWTPDRPVCITSARFEEFCVRQGMVMTMEPEAQCVHKISVNGDSSTTRRNASIDTLTIVTGTAGGLLGFLLVIIAFVICQRRRMMRRMRMATSRRVRSLEDERMLIYCSNDFHFFLPSYDEAMRSRPAEPPPFDAVVSETEARPTNAEQEGQSATNGVHGSPSPSSNENPYDTIDNVTVSPEPGQPTSSASTSPESAYSTVPREATSSGNNEDTVSNRNENGGTQSNAEQHSSASDRAAVNVRLGSVSSQESASDENLPLI